jgi:V/A-type H+-transporting ATPase subunit E
VAAAEKDAAAKIAAAEAKAAELDKNTRAELKLYAEQSVNAIKTEVTNLITNKIVSDSVKAATADKAFMQKLIANLAAELAKGGDVIIEAKDAEELKKYVAANAKGLLDKGVKIEEVKGLKTDFAIVPEKGGYKLTFGDNEFVEYFKEYLRPQIQELLF